MPHDAKTITPFGHWPSPLAADVVAGSARRFGIVQGAGAWVYWIEGRPAERGRQVIVRAKPGTAPEDVLPAPYSARSKVHEYGGGDFLVVGDLVYFINDADQDIYTLRLGSSQPERLTTAHDVRLADMTLDASRHRLIAVAERSTGTGPHDLPQNLLVAVALDGRARGEISDLATGHDFFGFPRISPDGQHLAYLAWDLPDMPWDQAELVIADFEADGTLGAREQVAGGHGIAAMQPSWTSDGALIFITDLSGWGNPATWRDGAVWMLDVREAEYGSPMWTLGSRNYAVDANGAVISAMTEAGEQRLAILGTSVAPPQAEVRDPGVANLGALTAFDAGIAAIAGQWDKPNAVVAFGPDLASPAILRSAADVDLSADNISTPRVIAFEGGDGVTTYGLYYPPTNADHEGPAGMAPPVIVQAHGGPTSSAGRGLALGKQFYTSRGFAIFDVDYSGSTLYGRPYRERLDGRWGIADVDDCAAGARYLATAGLADPARIAISGGSAGGYTVLMALATTDVFAAGSSHYGICDLGLLMEHTHKFESGYLHRLLGTTPQDWRATCTARSPLTHIESIKSPVILFQGLDDRVVPPEQSRLIAERLTSRGIDVTLHEFVGEGHGFRRAETIISVLEAELAFLRRALRLEATPAGTA
jgi:dipeptidyl aminopeptidase/acylaminoacyl peptidase